MATRIGIDTGGTFTDIVRYSPRDVQVYKVPGVENPADLMTKVLSVGEVNERLSEINLKARFTGGPRV